MINPGGIGGIDVGGGLQVGMPHHGGGMHGGGMHGGGHQHYQLPPPPSSSAGRVIIRAEVHSVDGGGISQMSPLNPAGALPDVDLNKFAPQLDGNRGFVLKANKDWLRAAQLDDLLAKLKAFGNNEGPGEPFNPAKDLIASASSSGRNHFCMMACGMLSFFAMMAYIMRYQFHNSDSEVTFTPLFGFGGVLSLAVCGFCGIYRMGQQGFSQMSVAFDKLNQLATERSGWARLWSAQNTWGELTYVGNRTNPPYFELSGADDGNDV